MLTVLDQLRDIAGTLSIVSDAIGPVEPGQAINVEVVSTAQQLSAANPLSLGAIGQPLPTVPAIQALPPLSVRIHVEWQVFEVDENEQVKALTPGSEYLTPAVARGLAAGPSGSRTSFLFKPAFVEMSPQEGALPLRKIRIAPTITLEAQPLDGLLGNPIKYTFPDDATRKERPDLLNLELQLLPVEIPSLLVLFRHNRYRPIENDMTPGFALAIFRYEGSFREVTQLINDVLGRIEEAIRPLKAFAELAAFLTKLPLLRSALGAQPMVRTLAGRVKNLDDIHMRTDRFLGFDMFERDLRAEDRASSLIFLGPPGANVGCYSRRDFDPDGGLLKITSPLSMIVLLDDLSDLTKQSMKPEGVEVVEEDNDSDHFENSFSSIKFDPQ